ncbi:Cytochrome c oxidase subunit 6B [Saitozyma podzolica]|uniref:Cytochrome c oxidase subunit 6B n=1 Tax=Saitozyma podzolica TaxID=1890683 RepID=A0A427YVS3_9TREE|nr:Cytochrome c oxidase subunit 6B [Saitozyma podzolica]
MSEKTYVLQTAGFDARFPNTNQTKHCWVSAPRLGSLYLHLTSLSLQSLGQNYVDYHKCVNAKGEDFPPCQQFKRAYRSLCPNEWSGKWDEQIENGTFPASLKP